MRDGLEGRFDLTAPSNWPAVLERLKRVGRRRRARSRADVAQQFGDTEAAQTESGDRAEQDRADRRAPPRPADAHRPAPAAARRRASSGARRSSDSASTPSGRCGFDDEALGRLLIERYSTFSGAEKSEALQTLASRRRYGRLLTEALAKEIVPRRDVPAHVAQAAAPGRRHRIHRRLGTGRAERRPRNRRTPDTGRFSTTPRSTGANVQQRTRGLPAHVRRRATRCTAKAARSVRTSPVRTAPIWTTCSSTS